MTRKQDEPRGEPEGAIESPDAESGWPELLDFVRSSRGVDLQGYKPTGLARRIRKRMSMIGLKQFADYQDYLEVHPEEFPLLFDTILINVTTFFRDPDAWEVLRTESIPDILGRKHPDEHIRIWSAGCASGEEAYSAAILFVEALGADVFRKRVKIYATDIDEDALATARHAVYTAHHLEGMPPELLERYFEPFEDRFAFRKDLRRQVIFGRHDVMQDPPISRIDLLLCRNTLMYFGAETQARILARFHFALNEGGHLFLGRAETLMAHSQAFVPVSQKARISRNAGASLGADPVAPAVPFAEVERGRRGPGASLHEAALQALPAAYVVIDRDGSTAAISERARLLFGLGPEDLSRPLRDLRLSYQPVELRSLVEQATLDRRPVLVRDVEWRPAQGDTRWFDVQVHPLMDRDGAPLGTGISFTDVSVHRRLQNQLEETGYRLEAVNEELQSTNEELETTNEELQSTIEELETTNEELQSTNEELETMNEELHSTNEELNAVNEELNIRGEQLDVTNAYLESVIDSLSSGVAVLDREQRVVGWNGRAEELWGLRAEEVRNQHFMNLDIGLPVQELRSLIRDCLTGATPRGATTIDAINRRGQALRCQIVCSPLTDGRDGVRGAILVMEDADVGSTQARDPA